MAPLSCCLLRPDLIDDHISEGNRYRDGIVTVHVLDATTKSPVGAFEVLLTYGDRNSAPRFNEVRTPGVGRSATFTISYPTAGYRHAGRPDGFAFFDENNRYKLEVFANGYRTASLPFPEYVVHDRQFPPPDLPPITVELKRRSIGEPENELDYSGWDRYRTEYMARFLDARLSSDVRHHAGFQLTRCPAPHSEEIIALVAGQLDSEDPKMQLSAAWILGEIAPDAPTKVDIWYGGRRDLFLKKYEANVPLFRNWWKARKAQIKPQASRDGRGAFGGGRLLRGTDHVDMKR
jgi:hypothetical protein